MLVVPRAFVEGMVYFTTVFDSVSVETADLRAKTRNEVNVKLFKKINNLLKMQIADSAKISTFMKSQSAAMESNSVQKRIFV